jgi:flavin reductase (DIM6/NTAB) family NADH-FMN oxidoreductase RutF
VEVKTVVDANEFRRLMAGFPSGIAVLTTIDGEGDPVGLTCSALCAVSLEPSLMLACIHNGSRTLDAVQDRKRFAVNMLHWQGRHAAEIFSTAGPDRFAAVRWSPLPGIGLPCLIGHAHSVAECLVVSTAVAGDHTVVIAEVVGVEHLDSQPPLIYGLREYAAWPGERNGSAKAVAQ